MYYLKIHFLIPYVLFPSVLLKTLKPVVYYLQGLPLPVILMDRASIPKLLKMLIASLLMLFTK